MAAQSEEGAGAAPFPAGGGRARGPQRPALLALAAAAAAACVAGAALGAIYY